MRTLTTPVSEVVAENQMIIQGQYHLATDSVGAINWDNSYYMIWVKSFPSEKIESKKVAIANLPASIKTALKALHTNSEAAAEAAGIMGAGSSVDDLTSV